MIFIKAGGPDEEAYPTIGAALKVLHESHSDEEAVITIAPGIYHEKLMITRSGITLRGAGVGSTVISGNDYALKIDVVNEEPYGTFRTAVVFVNGDDFCAEGITFENTAGEGAYYGQALAVYSGGNRAVFKQCAFKGFQDTLFVAPLPETPLKRGLFGAPYESSVREPTLQYFEECFIEGDIDFIFGGATAYFYKCHIHCIGDRGGYITAPCTPDYVGHGFVFYDCDVTGEAARAFYLGRPWRKDGASAFVRCRLGEAVHSDLWHDWGKEAARRVRRFISCACTPDYTGVSWAVSAEDAEAINYERGEILAGWKEPRPF